MISTITNSSAWAFMSMSLLSPSSTEINKIPVEINSTSQVSELPITRSSSTRPNDKRRYSLDKLLRNKGILSNLSRLEANWNSYGAEPINPSIIDKIEDLLPELDFQPKIFPTGRGTIQIEYFKDDENQIEIEISENENFMYKVENDIEMERVMNLDEIRLIVSNFYA